MHKSYREGRTRIDMETRVARGEVFTKGWNGRFYFVFVKLCQSVGFMMVARPERESARSNTFRTGKKIRKCRRRGIEARMPQSLG